MLIHSIWQSHWQVLTLVDAFTIRIFLITLTGMATIRQAIAHHPVYKSDIRSINGSIVRSLAYACNRVTVVLVVSQYTFNRTSRVWLLWLIITNWWTCQFWTSRPAVSQREGTSPPAAPPPRTRRQDNQTTRQPTTRSSTSRKETSIFSKL